MIHYFHFTLDRETIELLMGAGELEKLSEVAGFIVRVLERCRWFMEKHHFTAEEMGCRYARISEDLSDSRVKFWLPLPEEMYRRIKQVHQDLNYFSMAQVVRVVIRMFLGLRENHSLQEVFNLFKVWAEKWAAELKANRVDVIKLSHMREQSAFLAGKLSPYLIIYDRKARPLKKMTY